MIKGNNITVDVNHAVLKGSKNNNAPHEFYGVAVFTDGGKNITLKNLSASGYRVALMARNVDGLRIENCDFSYNYRQRLNSTQGKEDISDWMSYHKNEADEWLQYGAAIYLRGCSHAIISSNKVTGGQNALMMTGCNGTNHLQLRLFPLTPSPGTMAYGFMWMANGCWIKGTLPPTRLIKHPIKR